MNKQLQRLIELSSKTGDRLIVFDLNKENSPYVVMGVDDYERIAIGMSEVRGLTEDELLDKINRDIAIWQSDRIDNEGQLKSGKYNEEKVDFDDEFDEIEDSQDEDWYSVERIAKKTRDTAYLVIRDGYDSLCIDRVEGTAPLRLMLDVGARRPLGMGAASLSLFAFSSDKTVEKILRFNEMRFREHSGMGIADMRKLIALCRQKGYTLTAGVVDRGVTGIGVPLYDRKNKIRGAISVAAISEKIDKTRYDDIAALIKAEVDKTYHPPN